MIAGWTQSHTNLTASVVDDQIARMSVLDHEDHRLFHVMIATSVFDMIVHRCCKVKQQPFPSRRCEVLMAFRKVVASSELVSSSS